MRITSSRKKIAVIARSDSDEAISKMLANFSKIASGSPRDDE